MGKSKEGFSNLVDDANAILLEDCRACGFLGGRDRWIMVMWNVMCAIFFVTILKYSESVHRKIQQRSLIWAWCGRIFFSQYLIHTSSHINSWNITQSWQVYWVAGILPDGSSNEDTARNEPQAKRNLRIRGLLKTWRDSAETAPKPTKMDAGHNPWAMAAMAAMAMALWVK